MGRASRMKAKARAERQPRKVSIYNPSNGHTEEHETTISSLGVHDWIIDRRRLAAKGYPDRLPDIDTPRFRGWTAGGPISESDLQGAVVMGPARGRLIVSLCANFLDETQKVFFEESADGMLEVTFRCDDRPDSVYSVKPKAGVTADELVELFMPDLLDHYAAHRVRVEVIRPEDLLTAAA
jgi:hypothetical protein